VKLYAERPFRIVAQVVGDLVLLAWIGGWWWLGTQLHDQLDALRRPAIRVGQASEGLANSLQGTSEQVRSLQLVGDVLAAPFDAIIASARELTTASTNGQQTIGRLADLSIPLVALFPVLFALAVWIALRGRWIKRATAAARLRDTGAGEGLLAAQALTSARLDLMAEFNIGDNPLNDQASRRRLANFALRQLGLRGYDHPSTT
jgi:hypothetical protein